MSGYFFINQPNGAGFLFIFVLLLLLNTTGYAQHRKQAYLTVRGEVEKPLRLIMKDLAEMDQKEILTQDMDGNDQTFQGVALVDILNLAGVTLGSQLRGENLVKYVLIEAVDGYQVIFSLPEIDPEFTEHIVLLAYLVNGKPLAAGMGPFRLVVPHENKHARWVREVSSIQVLFVKE